MSTLHIRFMVVAISGLVGWDSWAGGSEHLARITPDAEHQMWFGAAVEVEEDMLIVGSPLAHPDVGDGSGCVIVYRKVNGAWERDQVLDAEDRRPGDEFGGSLSLDGEYLVVGAPHALNGSGIEAGAAYIYHRGNDRWKFRAKIVAPDGQLDDEFGYDVSISGHRILAAAPFDNHIGSSTGSAYVFRRESGREWPFEAQLRWGPGFAWAVLLHGDVAYVGAPAEHLSNGEKGAAYVFARDEATEAWIHIQRFVAPDDGISHLFGNCFAREGNLVAIGDNCWESFDGVYPGAAYLFAVEGDETLTFLDMITPPSGQHNGLFGDSVVLADARLFVAAPREQMSPGHKGVVYAFAKLGSDWVEIERITGAGDPNSSEFGHSLDVAGNTLAVGSKTSGDTGAVDLYSIEHLGFPAQLKSVSLRFGENLQGGLGRARHSDDQYLKADSIWDAGALAHRVRIHADLTCAPGPISNMTLAVEAAINEPSARIKLCLFDWTERRWIRVASRYVGTSDQTYLVSGLEPSRFVEDRGVRVRIDTRVAIPLGESCRTSIDRIDVSTR